MTNFALLDTNAISNLLKRDDPIRILHNLDWLIVWHPINEVELSKCKLIDNYFDLILNIESPLLLPKEIDEMIKYEYENYNLSVATTDRNIRIPPFDWGEFSGTGYFTKKAINEKEIV